MRPALSDFLLLELLRVKGHGGSEATRVLVSLNLQVSLVPPGASGVFDPADLGRVTMEDASDCAAGRSDGGWRILAHISGFLPLSHGGSSAGWCSRTLRFTGSSTGSWEFGGGVGCCRNLIINVLPVSP
ncbi:unnamed protein product [Pleuronectes platessa]|uniref:Uncharacterized protein n=1 Tax=Pleuronectes platessa TaxID=8262 RepID=A0A9N7YIA2_PLEPL|nr:unnamed protein product [Pleuronectes platessa]